MNLVDFIKQKHAKSFTKEAKRRIEHHQFSCFITKPFCYLYSLDLINKELEKDDLYVSSIKKTYFETQFIVSRCE